MAIKPDYVARETLVNLRRNLTLTVASIATMAVALGLFGSARMFGAGTENGTQRFRDGVEFLVYLDPDIDGAQFDSISQALRTHPDIQGDELIYCDQDCTYEEFLRIFSQDPDLIDSITPEILPTSFRVKPRDGNPDVVASLASQFRQRPGVYSVATADEVNRAITGIADLAERWMLVGSLAALVGGALAIFNTVRVAMFARRREIEVMKVVGASNWFIRLPFVLEGLLHGVIGGGLAVLAVRFLRSSLEDDVRSSQAALLENFFVSDAQMFSVTVLVLATGAVVGVVCSAFAVGRYLDV